MSTRRVVFHWVCVNCGGCLMRGRSKAGRSFWLHTSNSPERCWTPKKKLGAAAGVHASFQGHRPSSETPRSTRGEHR